MSQSRAACSDRVAGGVRRVVEWFLRLTLREWIILSACAAIVVATGCQQYFAYHAILPYYEEAHKTLAKFDAECMVIQQKHATAYIRMQEDCIKANITVRLGPKWNAIQMLVNTSWPHAENIVDRLTSFGSKLISSFQGVCLVFALFVTAWPSLKKQLGFVSDVYNRAKSDKLNIELQKFVAAQTLTLSALHKQPQRIAPLTVDEAQDKSALASST